MTIVKRFPDEVRTVTRDGQVLGTYTVDGLLIERERAKDIAVQILSIDPNSLPSGTLRNLLLMARALVLLLMPLEELK